MRNHTYSAHNRRAHAANEAYGRNVRTVNRAWARNRPHDVMHRRIAAAYLSSHNLRRAEANIVRPYNNRVARYAAHGRIWP